MVPSTGDGSCSSYVPQIIRLWLLPSNFPISYPTVFLMTTWISSNSTVLLFRLTFFSPRVSFYTCSWSPPLFLFSSCSVSLVFSSPKFVQTSLAHFCPEGVGGLLTAGLLKASSMLAYQLDAPPMGPLPFLGRSCPFHPPKGAKAISVFRAFYPVFEFPFFVAFGTAGSQFFHSHPVGPFSTAPVYPFLVLVFFCLESIFSPVLCRLLRFPFFHLPLSLPSGGDVEVTQFFPS